MNFSKTLLDFSTPPLRRINARTIVNSGNTLTERNRSAGSQRPLKDGFIQREESFYSLWLKGTLAVPLALLAMLCISNSAYSQKKGGLLDALNRTLGTDGQPLITKQRVINGEWSEFGSGAGFNFGNSHQRTFSPRNHIYELEVTQDNAMVKIQSESTTEIAACIVSDNGQIYNYSFVGHGSSQQKLLRAGKYRLFVYAFQRGAIGKYRLAVDGPIGNIVKDTKAQTWVSKDNDFGPEGGGGVGTYSPRSQDYSFIPKFGTYFDVNVESDGVPISIFILDPSGKVFTGYSQDNSPGLRYHVIKADQKGTYRILVCTEKANDHGKYKIEVMGELDQAPIPIPIRTETIRGTFSNSSLNHVYLLEGVKRGNLEVMYRSPQVETSNLAFTDNYGSVIYPQHNYSPSARLVNRVIPVQQDGNITLKLDGVLPGDYELLVWGHYDQIIPRHPAPSNSKQGESSATGSGDISGRISIAGRIEAKRNPFNFDALEIIVDDLETGERFGSVKPDKQGNYTILVPPGKQYSVTAVTGPDQIASSYSIDLTKTSKPIPTGKVTAQPITILYTTDIGQKLTLNNIFFETGNAILQRRSYAELRRIGAFLKNNKGVKVEIAGHTDNVGDDASNLKLSQDRANQVLFYLQDSIEDNGTRLKAKGYGKREPVFSNNTDQGRQQNRRVEFKLVP